MWRILWLLLACTWGAGFTESRSTPADEPPRALAPPSNPPRESDELQPAQRDQDSRRGRVRRSSERAAVGKNAASVKSAFRELTQPTADATVQILVNGRPAMLGAVVDPHGLIVTKASALSGDVTVRWRDGLTLPAAVAGIDDDFDIALMQVNAVDLKPVRWRDQRVPPPGSWLAAVDPAGQPLSVGVVSAEPRRFLTRRRPPNNQRRGYLGITVEPDAERGLLITEVSAKAAADKAGIKAGDLLTEFDGQPIRTFERLVEMLGRHNPGHEVTAIVRRNDKPIEMKVVLDELPDDLRLEPEDHWGGGPFSTRRFGFPRVLPHDMIVHPNQCGGPIVDTDGAVVGINIARVLRVATYAVLADDVQAVVEKLKQQAATKLPTATTERIIPAGIDGSLILAGRTVPDAAFDAFVELAHGKQAQLVLVHLAAENEENAAAAKTLSSKLQDRQPASLTEVRIDSAATAKNADTQAAFQQATGIWFIADETTDMRALFFETELGAQSRAALARGGVVGGSAVFASWAASEALTDDGASDGWGLLPDGLIDATPGSTDGRSQLASVLIARPHLVGYEIGGDAALVVRGRRVRAVGGGSIVVSLAASKSRPAKQMMLTGRQSIADLTALRKSARGRAGADFPPAEAGDPHVEHGTLVIIGGGGMPAGLAQRFVDLAGGNQASIVVLPTAMPDPIPKSDGIVRLFEEAGAKNVVVLPGRTREKVESPEYLDALRQATGIWFGGGRQWRFADAYLDTQALPLMDDVLRRGGVIGGSSAGASIQAEYLARANPLGNLDIMAEGYEQGLGFLPGAAIDQHFSQRKRQPDMTSLMTAYPQFLGIGIDETTAIVVQGHVAEVTGRNGVYFYDTQKTNEPGQPDYEVVHDGGQYDLRTRQVLDPGEIPAPAK